ncbi:putative membrane protein YvbJ [Bacillus fengqiuensis]|nr:putative membrane protein YvbJ [Bacillus fengqiuensis]
MKVCVKCGAPIEKKSYCRVCGHALGDEWNERKEETASLKLQAEGKRTLTKRVVWTSLFIFLAAVLVAVGCTAFLSK